MVSRTAVVWPFQKTSTCKSTMTLAVLLDPTSAAVVFITDCTKGHKDYRYS